MIHAARFPSATWEDDAAAGAPVPRWAWCDRCSRPMPRTPGGACVDCTAEREGAVEDLRPDGTPPPPPPRPIPDGGWYIPPEQYSKSQLALARSLLTPRQWEIFNRFRKIGRAPVSRIAEAEGISRASVSEMVARINERLAAGGVRLLPNQRPADFS